MYEDFISTKVGSFFQIKLDFTPTTGYDWKLLSTLESMKILKLLNEYREQKPLIGVSIHIFNFEALSSGTETVSFGYMRPWDKGNIRKQRTFRVQILG